MFFLGVAYDTPLRIDAGPLSRIDRDMIHITDSQTCIDGNFSIMSFTPSGSMRPTIDYGHNALILESKYYNIGVGDIISFNVDDLPIPIMHRVVKVSYDNDGWYVRTKGDNNVFKDTYLIRGDDINGVATMIIY